VKLPRLPGRRLSFRQRLMLFTAAAIAVTVAGASVAVWAISKHELYRQLDQTLNLQVASSAHGFFGRGNPWTEVVTPAGATNGVIPVSQLVISAANGKAPVTYIDTTIEGNRWREVVVPVQGGAVVSVHPLEPTLGALRRIRFWIALIGGIGVALAAALAALVANAALRPVRRLRAAAETVAATGDLSERVQVSGEDELGRLATRFNEMLAALETSVGAQRRLVADASHELRTPLTAARTNVELVREGKLGEDEAGRALDEATVELDALTTLVSDLVELARGEERKLRFEPVQLDDLVAGVVERARARSPQMTFATALSPTQVDGDPMLLERAVSNLIDNAVKWSPPGGPVEVTVRAGEVLVTDHGPGVAEQDLPHVFDRFYRAAAARAKPGAGLGLAIVREAATVHGGSASVENGARGARFRLTLPASA
jgi:two-component system, OmpR family, sensor histidine kinase MprB